MWLEGFLIHQNLHTKDMPTFFFTIVRDIFHPLMKICTEYQTLRIPLTAVTVAGESRKQHITIYKLIEAQSFFFSAGVSKWRPASQIHHA